MIRQFLLVGLGGAAGSMFRYFTSLMVLKFFNTVYPLATFIANILGCLLIGILVSLLSKNTASDFHLRLLLITGFCGGYTTFSAFSYENILLANNNGSLAVAAYIAASVAGGMLAVWIGLKLG